MKPIRNWSIIILTSAVKKDYSWLITSKIKVFVYKIYVCTVYIYHVYLKAHTYSIYFEENAHVFTCIYLYSYKYYNI